MKKKGLPPHKIVLHFAYIANSDDPYAKRQMDAIEGEEHGEDTKGWLTYKTVSINRNGDIGLASQLNSRSSTGRLSGIQNGIVYVIEKDEWLNSNGKKAFHIANIDPPSQAQYDVMVRHFPKSGSDLRPAEERTVSEPFIQGKGNWASVSVPARPDGGPLAVKIKRLSYDLDLGKELKAKFYLRLSIGDDLKELQSAKTLETLMKTYGVRREVARRIRNEYIKESGLK